MVTMAPRAYVFVSDLVPSPPTSYNWFPCRSALYYPLIALTMPTLLLLCYTAKSFNAFICRRVQASFNDRFILGFTVLLNCACLLVVVFFFFLVYDHGLSLFSSVCLCLDPRGVRMLQTKHKASLRNSVLPHLNARPSDKFSIIACSPQSALESLNQTR